MDSDGITLESLSERMDELESSFDEFTRVIVDYIVNYGGKDE